MRYKEICCVTGSRAEFGILKPLLSKLKDSKAFNLNLVATGSHFSQDHGCSINEIKSNFSVAKEINCIQKGDDSQKAKIHEMSCIQIQFTQYLLKNKPDLVVVIGDRYEMLPIAISAYMLSIPIAHIHGGEKTLGSLDEGIRHAITQLSTIHFTSTKEYAKRIEEMGINVNLIRNVGALGVERVLNHNFKNRNDIEKELGFRFGKKNAVCTFHPPTLEKINTKLFFKNLIAISKTHTDFNIIFTGANADSGGTKINQLLKKYSEDNKNLYFQASLGESLFLDVLNQVDFLIGNSSSAFLEAPALKKPAINVGMRQSGRVPPKNIVNSEVSFDSLNKAIKRVLKMNSDNELENFVNPYGNGSASNQIIEFLLKHKIS